MKHAPSTARLLAAFVCLAVLFALPAPAVAVDSAANDGAADADHVQARALALLEARCFACHGAEKQEGGLDLRYRQSLLNGGETGPAIVPNNPAESLLYRRVHAGEMPPDETDRLTEEEERVLLEWIEAGAPAPSASGPVKAATLEEALAFWSLKRPSLPPLPTTSGNPIDAFVDAQLSTRGLPRAPRADRATLVRRAYFDLLGLPPTPEQAARFVADNSPDAWARLIDELLASPHYGERYGRHWLDAARYADTGGYETDIYFKNAWRYRDYVVKSFNDDKPYDVFVQEQVAGDEMWPDDLDLEGSYVMPAEKLRHLEARVATGLYALGPQIHESNMDAGKYDYERLTDWADTTGSLFLGLSFGCARCHDHKFDPISQEDYYGLQAAFAASKEVEIPVVNAMEITDHKQFYPKLIAVDEARKAYRLFEKRTAGRELSDAEKAQRQALLEAIANAVLQLPEAAGSTPATPYDGLMDIPTATVLEHERPELVPVVRVLARGELSRPKEAVAPALPKALSLASGRPTCALAEPFSSRKELALWLTSPENPLVARVIVNRVWQWHFGRGLVATPNDFGKMGLAPTHPELFDWLACHLVQSGWRIKDLHRLIMQSDAYCRDSRFQNEEVARVDADNQHLWRMNRRRLEAETLWDAMHAVAGTINLKMGGRPVVPPISQDEISSMRDPWQWTVTADPAEHTRRGMYILVRRNFLFPMFEAFDAPVNAVSCPARDVTTVAPQALWCLNSKTAQAQSQAFAARIAREAPGGPAAWVRRAWELALARAPTAEEEAEALRLIEVLAGDESLTALTEPPTELAALPPKQAAALVSFCLALFNTNEFTYVD